MDRISIINDIANRSKSKSYLEIGIRQPSDCFDLINCEVKDSVDPGYENPNNPAKYKFTSDSFFTLLESGSLDKSPDYKWDLVFIDGLHISDQVERDILNSLNHLSEGGTIVLHDCNPPTKHYAREDYDDHNTPALGYWNGSVWKAIYKMRCSRTDLDICVVDCDWGVGLIKRGNQEILEFDNQYYEFNKFEKNIVRSLNIIQETQFLNCLEKPFYNK